MTVVESTNECTEYQVLQVSRVRMNPYVHLLQAALQREGLACTVQDGLSPSRILSWFASTRPSGGERVRRVLHVHWIELLFASSSLLRSARRLASVTAALLLAKGRGCKIVYTVHNLNPHEQAFPGLDRVANLMLFLLADALHVHDETAKAAVLKASGLRGKVHVIPHGSYLDAYPALCTRSEAREHLGLPDDAFVYLFLGQIRRYKGLEALFDSFLRLEDGCAHLVVAGNPHDAMHGTDLTRMAQEHERIHTHMRYIPDDELQYFMNAADVSVLPYRDVTTSGAAVLAFSFGKPIIAPAVAGFVELAAGGRGITYDPVREDGLVDCLILARHSDMVAAGKQARVWAENHRWATLAPRFVRMYAEAF